MTLIEFYDCVSVENVAGFLKCRPERIVFLGDESKMTERVEIYEQIAQNHNMVIDFICKAIDRNNLSSIVDTLTHVVEGVFRENRYEKIFFDLSGGDDLALVAAGIVYERYAGKIKILRFNINDVSGMRLTVDEYIRIYGGRIQFSGVGGMGTYIWDFNEDFVSDIGKMWSICKNDPAGWNNAMNIMGRVVNNTGGKSSLKAFIKLNYNKKNYRGNTQKFNQMKEFMRNLLAEGLIRNLKISETGQILFSFKNHQVKKCLTKAGEVLEVYVTLMAKELTKENSNKPLFDDILTGVNIDWDGKPAPKGGANVDNEVDVVLIKDFVPVFISCKNGIFDSDELYKLSTVAAKFGGPYVKKVLVTTGLSRMNWGKQKQLKARAREMDIAIIDDFHVSDLHAKSSLLNAIK